MSDHLVISAVGNDQPGIVNKLSSLILDLDCNINDSRMAVLGGEFAVILLVNGEAARIQQLQQRLNEEQDNLELTIITRPTTEHAQAAQQQSRYNVTAEALDHPGIVQRLAGFFAERHINIENLSTGSSHAPHTGTVMFELSMQIDLSQHDTVEPLREQFITFCDDLNIDASLETAVNRSR